MECIRELCETTSRGKYEEDTRQLFTFQREPHRQVVCNSNPRGTLAAVGAREVSHDRRKMALYLTLAKITQGLVPNTCG
jgi:hypothetical protein